MKRQVGKKLAAVGLAAVVGCAIGITYPLSAGADVGGDVRLPPPGPMFKAAEERAPYHVRTPKYVPKGMTLFNVSYVQPDVGESAYSVDLWYRADDGRFFHIWQTDNQQLADAGKDPADAASGREEQIDGESWVRVDLDDRGLIVVSRRYPDSITLSLDGNVGIEELQRIAESIE